MIIFIAIIIIVALIISLPIYFATAILINKFHNVVYGKKTGLAWVPLGNHYLLGKLVFNKLCGWIFLGIIVLNILLVNPFMNALTIIIMITVIVFAFIKYSKIKDGILNTADVVAKCDTYDFPPDMEFLIGKSQNVPQQPQQRSNGKFCPNCGTPLADGTKFCPSCGQSIQ